MQRFGPDGSNPGVRQSLTDIDAVAGDLADAARASVRSVVVLPDYGITEVDHPIQINRVLRDAGLLVVRDEDGGDSGVGLNEAIPGDGQNRLTVLLVYCGGEHHSSPAEITLEDELAWRTTATI